MITDNESGVGVFSQSKEVMGILSGDDKGYCFLEYIHVTTEGIYEGEDIITSGKDGLPSIFNQSSLRRQDDFSHPIGFGFLPVFIMI